MAPTSPLRAYLIFIEIVNGKLTSDSGLVYISGVVAAAGFLPISGTFHIAGGVGKPSGDRRLVFSAETFASEKKANFIIVVYLEKDWV